MDDETATAQAADWTAQLADLKSRLFAGEPDETAALQEIAGIMSAIAEYKALQPQSHVFTPVMQGIMDMLC